MPNVDINWMAVVAAALVNMIIGSIWYSQFLFGKSWTKLTGKKAAEMGNGNVGYGLTAIGSLLQAYILAHFLSYTGSTTFTQGVITAFWIWLGFVAVTTAVNYVFEGRSWKLWKINAAYFLVVMAINGGLLAIWH